MKRAPADPTPGARAKAVFKPILLAYGFLTIIPGLGKVRVDPQDTGRSTGWYPLVGLTIGLLALPLGLAKGLSPFTIAVILCAVTLFLSRGLHADGLIDTFDGFLSGRRGRDEILGIMKDSRLGALGFLGAFCLYSLKIAFLYEVLAKLGAASPAGSLPGAHSGGGLPPLLFAPLPFSLWRDIPPSGLMAGRFPLFFAILPALSRGGVPVSCALFPYAGGKKGLGRSFTASVTWRAVTLSLLLMACVSLVPGNLFGLLLPPALVLFWAAWGLLCMRKIGGMTGDTMGAGVELSELFCLILVRAFFV
jgi:adenosylcobinamide-GDP ribazoletransferase